MVIAEEYENFLIGIATSGKMAHHVPETAPELNFGQPTDSFFYWL
jgi:hypothetical protein